MFARVGDLFGWFKKHFRDPLPGQNTPSTPRGAATSRTPYHNTPGVVGSESYNCVAAFTQTFLFLKDYFTIVFFFRHESRSYPESRTKSSTSHAPLALAGRESNTSSLSPSYAWYSGRCWIRRHAHVSEYTVYTVRSDPIYDTVSDASSHTASFATDAEIRSTDSQQSSRTIFASSCSAHDGYSSQIHSFASAYSSFDKLSW